jgi:lipoyl synthase
VSRRLPAWLRRPLARPGAANEVNALLGELELNTVCQSAKCPNRGECFSEGTATFMIMGDACTRSCRFCAVETRSPQPLDADEPRRVAEAVRRLGLRHAVVTSVTRDDLEDGGAAHFAAVVSAIKDEVPGVAVEVLTSDFGGDTAAVDVVLASRPDVYNHNLETVPRLYPTVRPGAEYERSLDILRHVSSSDTGIPAKSGLMLGLGETTAEVEAVMRDMRQAGVGMLTLGQYLAPSSLHLPVAEFVTPGVFAELGRTAYQLGFTAVASAPYVRSSYHAESLTPPKREEERSV